MPFSEKSRQRLSTCDQELQELFLGIDALGFECTIIEGHRGQKDQDRYYAKGRSKVKWPDGKHNQIPSKAVDVAPYVHGALSWNKNHCIYFAGVVMGVAKIIETKIRWGGNWDRDDEVITDQEFQDLVHFELVE